jgi:hypothetical protein
MKNQLKKQPLPGKYVDMGMTWFQSDPADNPGPRLDGHQALRNHSVKCPGDSKATIAKRNG